MFRLCVLASGAGTNLQAILDRFHGRDGIEVVGVGSDKPGAKALERAARRASRLPSSRRPTMPDRAARDAAMADWIEGRGADLVVLAGYMQLLSPPFVARFRNRDRQRPPGAPASFPASTRSARRSRRASR